MTPKESFQLAVRLLGLVFLYHGLMTLPEHFAQVFQGLLSLSLEGLISAVVSAWTLLVAWWLVRGAPLLLRIAYPEDPGE